MYPKVLKKRNWDALNEAAQGYLDESIYPTWFIPILKKKKGYRQMRVPKMCVGLNENEINEDLEFLKLVLDLQEASK
jgi:hypothetical protein